MKNRDKWDGNGKGDRLPTGMPGQSTFLKDWVTDGSLPGPNLNLLKLLQANISSHPDRGSALIETIGQLRSEYNGIWQEYSTAAWHKLPETWELKEDIDQALDDLLNYVQDLHITSSVTSDE